MLVTAGDDLSIVVSNAMTGTEVSRFYHKTSINALLITQNGKYCIVAGDDVVWIWDLDTGQRVAVLRHYGIITTMDLSPSGQYLATGGSDNQVIVWSTADWGKIMWSQYHGTVGKVKFLQSDTMLAVSVKQAPKHNLQVPDSLPFMKGPIERLLPTPANVYILNVETQENEHILEIPSEITSLTLSPSGKSLAVGSLDGGTFLYEVISWRQKAELRQRPRPVRSLLFTPDERYLIVGLESGTLPIWNLSTNDIEQTLHHPGVVLSTTLSPDGKFLIAGGADSIVRMWDLSANKAVHQFETQAELWRISTDGDISAIAIHPDHDLVAVAGQDHVVQIRSLTTTLFGRKIDSGQFLSQIYSLTLSRDGRWLAAGGDPFKVQTWGYPSGQLHQKWRLWAQGNSQFDQESFKPGIPLDVDFSPDAKFLATATGHNATVWNIQTGAKQGHYPHENAIRLAFNIRQNQLLTVDDKGKIIGWDMTNKSQVYEINLESPTASIIVHPTESYFVSGSHHITFHSTKDGSEIKRLDTGDSNSIVTALKFNREGTFFASGTNTGQVQVHSWPEGSLIAEFRHNDEITEVDFSWNSQFLLSASGDFDNITRTAGDNSLRIWNITSKEELVRMPQQLPISGALFDQEDNVLMTISEGGRPFVLIWNWKLEALEQMACERITRNLTLDEWQLALNNEPYQKTCKKLPPHHSLLSQARKYFEAGNEEAMAQEIDKVLEDFPDLQIEIEKHITRWTSLKHIQNGLIALRNGQLQEGLLSLQEAQKSAPMRPILPVEVWNSICWNGALAGFAKEVMDACDTAVAMDPESGVTRDSRGIARVQTGDIEGALEDFSVYLTWEIDQARKMKRQEWVTALSKGRNPFTPEVLKQLVTEQ